MQWSALRVSRYILLAPGLVLVIACGVDEPKGDWSWEPSVCQQGHNCCTRDELLCRGDPDSTTVCTCLRSWACDHVQFPSKCSQATPDTPAGGGGWSCSVVDTELERCLRDGTDVPTGANGWTCAALNGQVVCERKANTPDGSASWRCAYEGGVKQCEKVGGGGTTALPPRVSGSGCSRDAPPHVLLLLDRSGSMGALVAGKSKWAHATDAVNRLVTAFPGELHFGLMLLPAPGASCAPGVLNVPVDSNSASAIATAMSSFPPGGGTPIAATLQAALGVHASGDGVSSVLLVTDGGETCGGSPVAEVQALRTAGVSTYVVGFGSSVAGAQLDAMAVAGGTARSGSPSYYQAPDVTGLQTALNTAVKQGICR